MPPRRRHMNRPLVDLDMLGITELNDVSLVQAHSKWIMDGVSLAYPALVVVLAIQTNRLIEEPGRKTFSRLSPGRRVPAGLVPAAGRPKPAESSSLVGG